MRRKASINKPQLLKLILLIAVLLRPTLTMAQDDLPCGGEDPYATECPLDDWLNALIVGGVIYGGYAKSKSSKQMEKKPTEKEVSFKDIASQL